ncbi:FBP domain-containing protein [Aeromicrobium sp. CF3.5]|uniref:FBP domain-containing protein n=1 Tax=Aeromicrobium sp. CF3.5 TaxID=3373078 RepID=UPI003EE801AA
MQPLTERDIRASFVNTSRRETTQAPVPHDLTDRMWDDLDLLGWTDPKARQRGYVVVPTEAGPIGLLLRTESRGATRRAMCDWCQDPQATEGVVLYVARRAGASGKQGNSIGAMVHADLSCSRHARRRPTPEEAGRQPEAFVAGRVEALRERTARFATRVRDGD